MQFPGTLLLNVSLLPDDAVAGELVSRSATFHDLGQFTLDRIVRRPHLTLYMARFTIPSADTVADELAKLFGASPAVQAISDGLFVTEGNYVEVSYKRTRELIEIQQAVSDRLSPFKFVPRDYDSYYEDYFGKYSDQQRQNVHAWGYDLAGDLFRPHITLTRLKESESLFQVESTGPDYGFRAVTAGLFEADNLGAGRRPIREFTLFS